MIKEDSYLFDIFGSINLSISLPYYALLIQDLSGAIENTIVPSLLPSVKEYREA